MASSKEFAQYVTDDLFAHINGISAKRMFGGYGIYKDGLIFAIIVEDELYFKVDDSNRAQYEAADSEPFVYTGHKTKSPTAMPYWKVPAEILDDPEALEQAVNESVAITAKKKRG